MDKIKTRNPVAGNAWKYNKRLVVPPKKGKGSSYKRVKVSKKDITEMDKNQINEESPTKGTRLISKHEGKDGHHAEVRHSKEWEEYSVHHYHNGKHMGEGPVSYHGDDKSDAKDTAEYTTKHFKVKGNSLHKEETQIDEISNDKRKQYIKAAHKDVNSKLKTAETDKDYDKIYNRERHMDKAHNKVEGHLANYKTKHVSGLHNYNHREHPDGSFVQRRVDGSGPYIHQDAKTGKRTDHATHADLVKHVNKLHGSVKEDTQIDEISNKKLTQYILKASDKFKNHELGKDEHGQYGVQQNNGPNKDNMKRVKGVDKALKRVTKEETQIDELSIDKLKQYVSKAGGDKIKKTVVHNNSLVKDFKKNKGVESQNTLNLRKKIVNRAIGIQKAAKKVATEETQIDELSVMKKVGYIAKATVSGIKADHQSFTGSGVKSQSQQNSLDKTADKRSSGIKRAVSSLTKEDTQIDEISKKTLGSYIKKASSDRAEKRADQLIHSAGMGDTKPTQSSNQKNIKKVIKRTIGINRAVDKLTKEDIINKVIDKFIVSEDVPLVDRFEIAISKAPEHVQEEIRALYNTLTEDNQRLLYISLREENGINEVMDFIISNKE